jgi:hypothetical protein
MLKELKAARLVVQMFFPQLGGKGVLLHENNYAVCYILAGLTSRPPSMMTELRKLWHMLNKNGIDIRARYMRSAANVWADRLSRHLVSDDWQLYPVLFAELDSRSGPHSCGEYCPVTVRYRTSTSTRYDIYTVPSTDVVY